jgi:hypothetical protein
MLLCTSRPSHASTGLHYDHRSSWHGHPPPTTVRHPLRTPCTTPPTPVSQAPCSFWHGPGPLETVLSPNEPASHFAHAAHWPARLHIATRSLAPAIDPTEPLSVVAVLLKLEPQTEDVDSDPRTSAKAGLGYERRDTADENLPRRKWLVSCRYSGTPTSCSRHCTATANFAAGVIQAPAAGSVVQRQGGEFVHYIM